MPDYPPYRPAADNVEVDNSWWRDSDAPYEADDMEQEVPFHGDEYGVTDPESIPYDNIDWDRMEAWLVENVYSKGYSEDGKTGIIYDQDGKPIGQVPVFYKTN